MRAFALAALLALTACPSLEGFDVVPSAPKDSGVGEMAPLRCSKSAECNGARCIDGNCVAADGVCRAIGPFTDDSATVFGILDAQRGIAGVATTGSRAFVGKIIESWNALAPDLGASRFAAIACDESQGPAAVDKLSALKLPFVVGPTTAGVEGFSKAFDVLLAPYEDAMMSAPANVWSCANNRKYAAFAMRQAIDAVAKGLQLPKVKLLVALNDFNDAAFRDQMKMNLVFNGQSPDSTNYRDQMLGGAFDIDKSAVVIDNAITQFAPDLVVVIGSVWAAAYVDAMETAGIHPTYLIYGTSAPLERLPTIAALEKRVFALDVDRDVRLAENWSRVRAVAAEAGVPEPWGAAQLNDCTMMGMYATTVAARAGSDLRDTLATITKGNGALGDLTREGMPQAMLLARQGGLLELAGAELYYGYFGQNVPKAAPLALACVGSSGRWGFAGLRWTADQQLQSGALACQ